LVADTRFAESASALADAKAQLVTLELALEASEIRAPFAGYLNKVNLELGQYVRDGQAVAELFDFAPTLVRGALTEQQLARLERSATARVRLLNDQEYLAKLHYLGVQTNPETRMTDIELALQQNPPRPVAGITAEVTFDLPAEAAHRISPALFSLDQHGNLGVKVVQPDQRVAFWPTPLLGTDRQGFWIKRLPEDLLLISVGHGYARIGELVEVILGTEVQP
jgi:multidrug efflux system membrane fusion protein